ncbi:MAG: phospholipase A [Bacteriovoracaceae bacterium]|nr:phospholipase A [Bacteriovoracaceae bacterium]
MTRFYFYLFLFFIFVTTLPSYGIESTEIFTLHKNYLALGDKSTPVKFEFGFKYQFLQDVNLYFGYHQKTLWDINNGSSPVLDTNYNPQLFYSLGEHYGWFWNLGIIEHLSNGQTGSRSRGVNLSYLQMTKSISFERMEMDFGWKGFISYRKDDGSPDIVDYEGIWRGFVRLKNFLSFDPLYHAVELRVSPGGEWGSDFSNGNWELNFFFLPHASAKFTVFAQVFNGRSEYLLDNKEYHEAYRAGVAANF